MKPHIVLEENAGKVAEWLRTRGGIAVWASVDLSNPSASWTTPVKDAEGNMATKPTWQAGNVPTRVISDPAEIVVETTREVKRFHVAVRMASGGMSLKVTDAGTRKIRAAVAKAGEGAFYEFDYGTQEAIIKVPEKRVPLTEHPVWNLVNA